MVKVRFGIGIRIVSLFYAIYAVNMGVLHVGDGRYTLIFLFYANIAGNRDGTEDCFLELEYRRSPGL